MRYAEMKNHFIFLRYTTRFSWVASDHDISDKRTLFVCEQSGISAKFAKKLFLYKYKNSKCPDNVVLRIKSIKDYFKGFPNKNLKVHMVDKNYNPIKLPLKQI